MDKKPKKAKKNRRGFELIVASGNRVFKVKKLDTESLVITLYVIKKLKRLFEAEAGSDEEMAAEKDLIQYLNIITAFADATQD